MLRLLLPSFPPECDGRIQFQGAPRARAARQQGDAYGDGQCGQKRCPMGRDRDLENAERYSLSQERAQKETGGGAYGPKYRAFIEKKEHEDRKSTRLNS